MHMYNTFPTMKNWILSFHTTNNSFEICVAGETKDSVKIKLLTELRKLILAISNNTNLREATFDWIIINQKDFSLINFLKSEERFTSDDKLYDNIFDMISEISIKETSDTFYGSVVEFNKIVLNKII